MSGANYEVAEYDGRFESSAVAAPRRTDPGQATQIEQARAIAEVRAMVMIAMENPRNEEEARRKMQRVCRMPALAERAFFRVPRGTKKDDNGNTVKGPDGKPIPEFVNGETIQLARELARCWGNIDYSVREMSRDDTKGQSEMMACAWDLEENVRPSTVFIVAHKLGKFRITSNQQIYENNAGHAGRRLREMIFNALPEWFKAEAIDLCHETLKNGDGKTPFKDRIAACVEAFRAHSVTVEMLQKKIGRTMGEATPEDLATLRIMLRSIKRGEVTVADEFPSEHVEQERPSGDKLSVLEAKIGEAGSASVDSEATEAAPDPDATQAADLIDRINACATPAEVDALMSNTALRRHLSRWKDARPELVERVEAAAREKREKGE